MKEAWKPYEKNMKEPCAENGAMTHDAENHRNPR